MRQKSRAGSVREVMMLFNSVILLRSLSLSSESVVGEKLRHLFLSRSEEHTSELQSHRDLHSFPTRRSSDLASIAAVSTAGDVCPWAIAPPTDDQGCDKNQGQDRSAKS